jgi:hypothetical protein
LAKDEVKARAEATFIRKEQQTREGVKAMAEYKAASVAAAEKTARLKALRLAKEDADRKARPQVKPSRKRDAS